MAALAQCLAGIALGAISTVPLAWFLGKVRRGEAELTIEFGLACVLAPFLFIQAVLLVLWLLVPTAVLCVGTSAALTFLVWTSVLGIRTWHSIYK